MPVAYGAETRCSQLGMPAEQVLSSSKASAPAPLPAEHAKQHVPAHAPEQATAHVPAHAPALAPTHRAEVKPLYFMLNLEISQIILFIRWGFRGASFNGQGFEKVCSFVGMNSEFLL